MSAAREYSITPLTANPLRARRIRRAPVLMRERIRRVWSRNPNFEDGRWSKVRWRREGEIGRGLKELPVLVAALARLVARHPDDPRLPQIAAQLGLITPEGLGLERYRGERPGHGQGRERWYIAAAAAAAVSGALALIHATYALVESYSRTFARETRLMVAALARAVRRDGFRDHERVHPHPTSSDQAASSVIGSTSGPAGPDWLEGIRARRCGEAAAGAM